MKQLFKTSNYSTLIYNPLLLLQNSYPISVYDDNELIWRFYTYPLHGVSIDFNFNRRRGRLWPNRRFFRPQLLYSPEDERRDATE